MSENINSQFDFFKKVNLDEDGNIGVSLIGDSSSQPFSFSAENYSDLQSKTGMVNGDLAYVKNSQGTKWLPFSSGGTYYPSGLYLYSGGWVSDRNAISIQFNLDEQRIDNLELKNSDSSFSTIVPSSGFGLASSGFESISYSLLNNTLCVTGIVTRTGTAVVPTNLVIGVLPLGFRPAKTQYIFGSMGSAVTNNYNGVSILSINNLGEITLNNSNIITTSDVVRINGIIKI